MQIENGVFVVTGGGSGLGAATARMLVEAGGRVVLADVNREAGEATAAELGAAAAFVATDVTEEASAKAAIDRAVSGFGGLNGLINCAGVAPAEKVVGREAPHRLESFARTVSINLIGTFNMIRLAADVMSKAAPNDGGERGVIGGIRPFARRPDIIKQREPHRRCLGGKHIPQSVKPFCQFCDFCLFSCSKVVDQVICHSIDGSPVQIVGVFDLAQAIPIPIFVADYCGRKFLSSLVGCRHCSAHCRSGFDALINER